MYGQWSINNKGQVIMCGYKCKAKHEHLVGTYEQAMRYFTGSTEVAKNSKHYGKLINIVYVHQTNERFITKTSSELYNILMKNASTKKYWIPEEERHEKVLEVLRIAKDKHLLSDEDIIEAIKAKGEKATAWQLRRVYRQEQFEKYKL